MTTELRVIRDTGSPSGKYAVAWGVPGVSRLDRFIDANQSVKSSFPDDKVRNYLVEKRTLAVVGTLPLHTRRCRDEDGSFFNYKDGGNDWHGLGNNGRNHSDVSTHWSAAEEWVVILHSGKWWYNALYLGHRQANAFRFVEIGDGVEDTLRGYLHRTRRAAYVAAHRADERNPYVAVSSVRVAPPLVVLGIDSGIPRAENNPLGLNATLTLKIHTRRSGLAVSPVDLAVKR